MRQVLVFAFATGASQEAFDGVLANATLPASSWRRASFARDLYLDEIVDKCFEVRVGGVRYAVCTRYLGRVVAEPPSDARDVTLRRDVLRELGSSDEARRQAERVYAAIIRLRALFCAPRQPSPRGRRIEILRAAREVFDLLADSFAGATSALSRLRDFGAAVVAGEGYRRLVALLEHEENNSVARPPRADRRRRRGPLDADRGHPREPRKPLLRLRPPPPRGEAHPVLSRLPDHERRGGRARPLRRPDGGGRRGGHLLPAPRRPRGVPRVARLPRSRRERRTRDVAAGDRAAGRGPGGRRALQSAAARRRRHAARRAISAWAAARSCW